MSKKLQETQSLNIHVVSEEFLKEITTDRPSVVMEKCKISTWGILPHVRQQTKVEAEAKMKSGQQSSINTSGKSDRSYFHRLIPLKFSLVFLAHSKKSVPDKVKLKLKDGAAVDPDSGSSFLFIQPRRKTIVFSRS